MNVQIQLVIATSLTIMANLPLSADSLTKNNLYTPECGGGQVTVINPTGVDSCREAKDSSKAPYCLMITPNQQPSKQNAWTIKHQRSKDICMLKVQKQPSQQYVSPKPVCASYYKLKVDSKGLQDRCIKSARTYRIKCNKDEVHLTNGLDKCLTHDNSS